MFARFLLLLLIHIKQIRNNGDPDQLESGSKLQKRLYFGFSRTRVNVH